MKRPERTTEERDYYALNKRVYSKFAYFYDAVVFPIRSLRRQVAAIAKTRPNSKVLDVATGTGEQALAFAETGAEVIGVDISDAMLRMARRKNRYPNLTYLNADATALPFEDKRFDIACISFALHEMPRSIAESTLRELKRVTKLRGTIVIVDWGLPQNLIGRFILFHVVKTFERDHYAEFIRSDLHRLLEAAGIEVRSDRSVLLGAARIITASGRKEMHRR